VVGAALISGCAGRPAEAPPEEAEMQKRTLEVEVIDVDGNPASGAEVWVWERDQFGRDPQWTQHTGQDGLLSEFSNYLKLQPKLLLKRHRPLSLSPYTNRSTL